MGTRGAVGFQYDNGKFLAMYNHFDSYPEGLGADVVDTLKDYSLETIRYTLKNLQVFSENVDESDLEFMSLPTEQYSRSGAFSPSGQAQNTFKAILITAKIVDNTDFLKDSLFCEWAYIINLDDMTLDVYKGFQKQPDYSSPFGVEAYKSTTGDTYYPVSKLISFTLEDLPEEDQFCSAIYVEDNYRTAKYLLGENCTLQELITHIDPGYREGAAEYVRRHGSKVVAEE